MLYLHRVLISIRGAPQEYGITEDKLVQLEKLLQTIEGKLMDGHIFNVSVYMCVCV